MKSTALAGVGRTHTKHVETRIHSPPLLGQFGCLPDIVGAPPDYGEEVGGGLIKGGLKRQRSRAIEAPVVWLFL